MWLEYVQCTIETCQTSVRLNKQSMTRWQSMQTHTKLQVTCIYRSFPFRKDISVLYIILASRYIEVTGRLCDMYLVFIILLRTYDSSNPKQKCQRAPVYRHQGSSSGMIFIAGLDNHQQFHPDVNSMLHSTILF